MLWRPGVPEGFDEDHDGGNPEILAVEGGAEAAKEDPQIGRAHV